MLNWLKSKNKKQAGSSAKKEEVHALRQGRAGESTRRPARETVSARITQDLEIVPSNYQHQGARERQEDAFTLSKLEDEALVREKGVLAVVADGMGGLSVGEEASQVAVEVFCREYALLQPPASPQQALQRALRIANYAVFDRAFKDGEDVEMGTTLTAALIHGDRLYWVSAGDSRLYHFRAENLSQLTRDHTYANELKEEVRNGRITREEAERHPERGYLTSYLGLQHIPEIDEGPAPLALQPGDAVLVCSDGLYNALAPREMAAILRNGSVHAAEQLVKAALEKNLKHQDNITVVVLRLKSRSETIEGGAR